MILPSIDLMNGRVVQLVGGESLALEAGDPHPIAERFALAGEIAVVDLDAALGRDSNAELVASLVRRFPCRIGGGIRDLATARRWLDLGATRIVIGTAAEPELLRALPRERVIVALDARHGEVVDHGWTRGTGRGIAQRMTELRPHCGGFLVTFVEREGRMQGTAPLDELRALRALAGDRSLTIAGGVTGADEIAALDRIGCDAQVGMALYTGQLELADALAAPLTSDRQDGLWPTLCVDERGVLLGLAWSDRASLRAAVAERRGIYHSRTRGLWRKGESSGATQELLRIDLDCDRDALRFVVRQHGAGFCHRATLDLLGARPVASRALERTLAARLASGARRRVLHAQRLRAIPACSPPSCVEEARELAEAAAKPSVRRRTRPRTSSTSRWCALAACWRRPRARRRELDRRALRLSVAPATRKAGDEVPAR
jgi:phosphoribosyl-ATP pyrophosphohydrolase/phosphoribosyl-AMP cyclohydrolase